MLDSDGATHVATSSWVAGWRWSAPESWLWADDAGALWPVGGSGTVLRSSGDGHWTLAASLFALDLRGVWGSGAHDVYAVGHNGQIFHFDWDERAAATSITT